MKKLKIGFGEGGFQGFMARHVEKCVLVTVILLMAWFIYSGAGKSDVKITREKLTQNAQAADGNITKSRWEEVAPDRTPRTRPLEVILQQKNKIDSRGYAYTSWDMPLVPRLMPRMDPKIIAAEKVIATPFIGPLVLAPPEDEDAKLPPDRLKDFKVTLGGGGGGGYQGMMEDEEEEGSKSKSKGKKSKDSKEPKSPSMSMGPPPSMSSPGSGKSKGKKGDDPYASGSSSYSSGSSSYGNMMGGTTGRSISPEATQGVKANMNSLIEPSHAMVITAYVPYTKQWEAYRDAFKDAPGGQDPSRDVPNYRGVLVYRLDVTDNPSIDPATVPKEAWEQIKPQKLAALEKQYGAVIGELADPDAIDANLTHPVPPFLLTDLRSVLLHPDVERASNVIPKFEEEESTEEFIDTGEGVLMEDDSEAPSQSGGSFGGGMNRGSGGMMNRGSGGMGGMPKAPGAKMGGSSGFGGGSGYNPYSGSGGKSRMSGGSSGMGSSFGGGSMNLETYRPIPKKLVRFADFTAEPGHKYRYRVSVWLEDPNHPEDPEAEPEPTALDESVRQRIKDEVEPWEEKTGKRRYYRISDLSEPSAVASLPSPERFYAGETIPGATVPIAGVAVAIAEPQAKVLSVAWDPALGVFAPTEQTVHRASVLNFKSDVEVIHPVLGDLRKIEGYEMKTDGVVLDILGGEKVPGTPESKEIIRAPGETLIMDAEGNLVVTDESRDIEGYRKYIFPEPKKEEPKEKSKNEGPDDPGYMGSPSSMQKGPGGKGKGPSMQPYPSGKGGKMPKGSGKPMR